MCYNVFESGFAPVSIRRMRRFYDYFPIWSAVPTELTWSHFQELIPITRKEERDFYIQESIKSNWGYRELRRQIEKIVSSNYTENYTRNYTKKF